MELCGGGAEGQFVLQAPEGDAMVLGQHWLPPHPPLKPTNSELQSGAVPQGPPDVSAGKTDHSFRQLEIAEPPAVGRTAQEAGRIPPPQKFAEAGSQVVSFLAKRPAYLASRIAWREVRAFRPVLIL